MTGKLARVRWQMGQTLLPDHFIAQEEALLYESALRSRLAGLPAFGVANLKWNDALLTDGVLSISNARLVMQSGLLLEIPNNASVSPLNLNLPGSASVSVYLHLLGSSDDEAEGSWSAGEAVPRIQFKLALTADQSHADSVEAFKLAEFKKEPDGRWTLSPKHIPPLVLVGTSPFLQAELDELGPSLEGFQYKLMMDSASYLSGGSLYVVKQCLNSVFGVQRLLANLKGQVQVHPYHLYEALKNFYVQVCFYRDTAPKDVAEPYLHDQLYDCFQKILVPLKDQMQQAEKRSPYLAFSLQDGIYRLDLPDELKQAKDVYFLIQKDKTHRTVSLKDFKLAGTSRLNMMHKWALEGIPLRKVDRPVLAQSFGPEVDFYQLTTGDEWDNALRDGALSFYNQSEFQELEFYVYWYAG